MLWRVDLTRQLAPALPFNDVFVWRRCLDGPPGVIGIRIGRSSRHLLRIGLAQFAGLRMVVNEKRPELAVDVPFDFYPRWHRDNCTARLWVLDSLRQ